MKPLSPATAFAEVNAVFLALFALVIKISHWSITDTLWRSIAVYLGIALILTALSYIVKSAPMLRLFNISGNVCLVMSGIALFWSLGAEACRWWNPNKISPHAVLYTVTFLSIVLAVVLHFSEDDTNEKDK